MNYYVKINLYAANREEMLVYLDHVKKQVETIYDDGCGEWIYTWEKPNPLAVDLEDEEDCC